ncbi:MAG: Hsp20/alpha crystallin family protein [Prevotellaceae bacterium]|mgnify:FL=1|jgi:small heat shock protein|nr:Hsp20/alpha crystallin family protein [Prevotellaceae bacterium]
MYTRNNWLPEVFNDFLSNNDMNRTSATAPAINVLESEHSYTVELAAPGLTKDDFDVNINADGDLTVRMEKHSKDEEMQGRYLRREFAYSKYEQTLILPDDVDKEKIAARVADGILTVELPKKDINNNKITRSIEIG